MAAGGVLKGPFVSGIVLCGVALWLASCQPRPFFDDPAARPPRSTDPAVLRDSTAEPVLPGSEGPPVRAKGGVYKGTDRFTGQAASAPPPLTETLDGGFTLNFADADLREVVRAILGDTLGANFVVDPTVQGAVTLQTSRPIGRAALLPTLEHVLGLNGAALVQIDGLYKVVPADQAFRGTAKPRFYMPPRSGNAGTSVVIVPLEFVGALEMEKVLEPFAPPGGILRVDPGRNLIILGGSQNELMNMLDTVETFDVDWLAGMSFGLFPVQSAEAKAIVEELKEVFGDPAEGPLAGVLRFVAVDRLNAVLVISSRSVYVDKARTWIQRLDVGEGEVPRIFVYYVENSRAADLAAVLGEIFVGGEGVKRPALAPGLSPVALRTEEQKPEPVVSAVDPTGGGASLGMAGPVRIIADEVKNALVVLATPRDYRIIEAALKKLDIVPLQVLIEATILEVALNDSLQYGVEWFFRFGDTAATSRNRSSLPFSAVPGAASPLSGFTFVFQNADARVIIDALDAVSDINVISSPSIFVLDNQTASLQVGDQVPVATQARQGADVTSDLVQTIEYRDTGTILNVTPRVNAGGLVSMEVSQEVSNVRAEERPESRQPVDSPTISTRKIESTVAVQSGQTVALGGLIRDERSRGSRGIPLLSRIPVLGFLFGSKSEQASRTELLVLITPRVVPNQEQARQVTEELRRRLRTIAPLEERL
ncbi:MAG: type II secretion system secretin GspD [Rhodospirillales bacterium]